MDAIKNNSYLRQVNWDHLYDVNRNSQETLQDANGIQGNSFTGLRAHYVLEERVAGLQRRLDIQSVYNTRFNNGLGFSPAEVRFRFSKPIIIKRSMIF
jgi:hypothetical protein